MVFILQPTQVIGLFVMIFSSDFFCCCCAMKELNLLILQPKTLCIIHNNFVVEKRRISSLFLSLSYDICRLNIFNNRSIFCLLKDNSCSLILTFTCFFLFRSCRLYASSTHKCLHNIHKNTSSYMKEGQVFNIESPFLL